MCCGIMLCVAAIMAMIAALAQALQTSAQMKRFRRGILPRTFEIMYPELRTSVIFHAIVLAQCLQCSEASKKVDA